MVKHNWICADKRVPAGRDAATYTVEIVRNTHSYVYIANSDVGSSPVPVIVGSDGSLSCFDPEAKGYAFDTATNRCKKGAASSPALTDAPAPAPTDAPAPAPTDATTSPSPSSLSLTGTWRDTQGSSDATVTLVQLVDTLPSSVTATKPDEDWSPATGTVFEPKTNEIVTRSGTVSVSDDQIAITMTFGSSTLVGTLDSEWSSISWQNGATWSRHNYYYHDDDYDYKRSQSSTTTTTTTTPLKKGNPDTSSDTSSTSTTDATTAAPDVADTGSSSSGGPLVALVVVAVNVAFWGAIIGGIVWLCRKKNKSSAGAGAPSSAGAGGQAQMQQVLPMQQVQGQQIQGQSMYTQPQPAGQQQQTPMQLPVVYGAQHQQNPVFVNGTSPFYSQTLSVRGSEQAQLQVHDPVSPIPMQAV